MLALTPLRKMRLPRKTPAPIRSPHGHREQVSRFPFQAAAPSLSPSQKSKSLEKTKCRRDENRPFIREAGDIVRLEAARRWQLLRPVVFVQFAPLHSPEQPEVAITMLAEFSASHRCRTEGMDRAQPG